MVHWPLRTIALPDRAAGTYDAWLNEIEERLSDPDCNRYLLCREALFDLYYPGAGDYDELLNDSETPAVTRSALLALDPNHITLEPEYYHEIDPERYARVKPLLWLWQSFDRSPLGGGNVDIGVKLRRILAKHIFQRCGQNFKCFQFVEFSFGYNMEVGDDVVVHRHVLLDDRGGIVLGNRVSVADYGNIYSHSHDVVDQENITTTKTVLADGVRLTYHATVLSGTHIGENAMLGAVAVATRDVRPYHVYLGVPARLVKAKPNAPPEYLDDPKQKGGADSS